MVFFPAALPAARDYLSRFFSASNSSKSRTILLYSAAGLSGAALTYLFDVDTKARLLLSWYGQQGQNSVDEEEVRTLQAGRQEQRPPNPAVPLTPEQTLLRSACWHDFGVTPLLRRCKFDQIKLTQPKSDIV